MTSFGPIDLDFRCQSVAHGASHALMLRTLRRLNPRHDSDSQLTDLERRGGGKLRAFLIAAPTLRGVRVPDLASPASPDTTKDERRLLRAIAAAEADDETLLDNYIYRLAIERAARVSLADALHVLAKTLALETAQERLCNGRWPMPSGATWQISSKRL